MKNNKQIENFIFFFLSLYNCISICADCNSKNPFWIVQNDKTNALWSEKNIYKIEQENVRLRLELHPKSGQGWNKIRVEEVDSKKILKLYAIGVGSQGYKPHGENPKKIQMGILFKCEKHGESLIKVVIPTQHNERENPGADITFYFRKDCGQGGIREGFNIASRIEAVGSGSLNETDVVAFDSVAKSTWTDGSVVVGGDVSSTDFWYWMTNFRGSVLFQTTATSDKDFLMIHLSGTGVKNYLDPKVGSEKLVVGYHCVSSKLPKEGTTSEIPTAEVSVKIQVIGWEPVNLKFKKQCNLAIDPEHYVNVYDEEGSQVILKGVPSSNWRINDKKNLNITTKNVKTFTVRLDKESKEYHYPVTATSSNPFIVDISTNGDLKESDYLSEVGKNIEVHHYCRDLGTSYITVMLPLSKSETLHWSYEVVCKEYPKPIVDNVLTANQIMFIICTILILASVLLFYYWDHIEKSLSLRFFSNKKKIRTNQKLQDPEDINL